MFARILIASVASLLLFALVSGQGCLSSSPTGNGGTTGADSGTGSQTGTSGGTQTGGSGSGSSGGETSNIIDVKIEDFAFTPRDVTIKAGQTVRWTNKDFPPHTVTSGNPEDSDKGSLFDSGTLGVGKTFQFTFTTPGTYEYYSTYNYAMAAMRDATVTVTPAQ